MFKERAGMVVIWWTLTETVWGNETVRMIRVVYEKAGKSGWGLWDILDVGLGWVGGDYGYWININIPICILTHWPALGTVLWPPTSVYAHWLHIRKSYSREKKPSTVSCVQASSHRLEPPLQYFYQGCPGWSTPDYNIQVGTVFTLFHKNLGKEIKGDQSTW